MKINAYITKFYPHHTWFWTFKRYRYIKGFILRVFGVYVNVRESNAMDKLIGIANKQSII